MLTHPADIQQAYTGKQTTIQHMLTRTAYCHTESYHNTAHSYIHQTAIIKNTYFGEVRWEKSQ